MLEVRTDGRAPERGLEKRRHAIWKSMVCARKPQQGECEISVRDVPGARVELTATRELIDEVDELPCVLFRVTRERLRL